MTKGSDRGAAGVEYALLASLIAAVFAVLAFQIGPKVAQGFETVTSAL